MAAMQVDTGGNTRGKTRVQRDSSEGKFVILFIRSLQMVPIRRNSAVRSGDATRNANCQM
jgi:hypothetical protein